MIVFSSSSSCAWVSLARCLAPSSRPPGSSSPSSGASSCSATPCWHTSGPGRSSCLPGSSWTARTASKSRQPRQVWTNRPWRGQTKGWNNFQTQTRFILFSNLFILSSKSVGQAKFTNIYTLSTWARKLVCDLNKPTEPTAEYEKHLQNGLHSTSHCIVARLWMKVFIIVHFMFVTHQGVVRMSQFELWINVTHEYFEQGKVIKWIPEMWAKEDFESTQPNFWFLDQLRILNAASTLWSVSLVKVILMIRRGAIHILN